MGLAADIHTVLLAVYQAEQFPGDVQRGRYTIDADALFKRTGLDPRLIDDAVTILEQRGHLAVERGGARAPFSFLDVELTPSGRLHAEEATDTSSGGPQPRKGSAVETKENSEDDPLAELKHAKSVLAAHLTGACPSCQKELQKDDTYEEAHDTVTRRWSCECGHKAFCPLPISRWAEDHKDAWEAKAAKRRAKEAITRCPDCRHESIKAEEVGQRGIGAAPLVLLACKTKSCSFTERRVQRAIGETARVGARQVLLYVVLGLVVILLAGAAMALDTVKDWSKRLFGGGLPPSPSTIVALPASALPSSGSSGDTVVLATVLERPENIPVDVLQNRLDQMTLPNPFASPGEPPNFLDPTHPIKALPVSKDAFAIETGGMADGKGRFAVVARTGNFTIERLYVRVHATAACNLRDEIARPMAPTSVWAYQLWIHNTHNIYELLPLNQAGQLATWTYKAPETEEFGLSLRAAPYTLYLVSLMAEVRDNMIARRFGVSSLLMPLLFVKGSMGGCMNLARWYSASLLARSDGVRPWRGEFGGTLSYQMAIADLEQSPAFANRVLLLTPTVTSDAVSDLQAVSQRFSGDLFLKRNAELFTHAVNAPLCPAGSARALSYKADTKSDDANTACANSISGKRQGIPWEVTTNGGRVICRCAVR